ncbi:hypothetical protein [Ochrovirga pacifica]|uniref:hypothetical protein n=1 Tax=Ochrovirga pacifica TaxID=1042376 RepID=UPI0002558E58|nr:hypothetical protein [Ochrovirga pacifica]
MPSRYKAIEKDTGYFITITPDGSSTTYTRPGLVPMFSPADLRGFLDMVKYAAEDGNDTHSVYGIVVTEKGNYMFTFTGTDADITHNNSLLASHFPDKAALDTRNAEMKDLSYGQVKPDGEGGDTTTQTSTTNNTETNVTEYTDEDGNKLLSRARIISSTEGGVCLCFNCVRTRIANKEEE